MAMRRSSFLVAGVCLGVVVLAPAQEQPEQRDPFRQVFTLRGVTLSDEQQGKVEELRKKHVPALTEVQRKQNQVFTPEQRQARREALEAARKEGKRGAELQQAVDKTVQLSEEQKQQLTAVQKERTELVDAIQNELRSFLTADQRRQLQRSAQDGPAVRPTHANVKYGPHERNVMDVWLAESGKPTPVLVSIHGGGFRGGNKSVDQNLLRQGLDLGISVVAITYRLSDQAIAPAQFHDSARAIQFIRHKAKEWNLDPTRIASTGGSAGAGLSLWLGFHDDLADPGSKDPVLKESSRLTCMVVYNGQTSYDPRFIRQLFPDTDTYLHPALAQLYEVDLAKLDQLPREKYKLFEETSPITHLSRDDVPAMLIYGTTLETPITSQGIGIHHPRFGQVLKEQMDKLKIECRVETGKRRGSDEWVKLNLDFVKKHFGMK
jgi:acetyl esterase/lipase